MLGMRVPNRLANNPMSCCPFAGEMNTIVGKYPQVRMFDFPIIQPWKMWI